MASYFSTTVAQAGLTAPQLVQEAISTAAAKYALDANLIKAIIAAESAWNPGALRAEPQINDASYGLMQILLATARGMQPGVTAGDLFIPSINVDLGSRYLAAQVNRYGYPAGVSAYNAGHPITGNATYVQTVDDYYNFYFEQEVAALPTDPFPGSARREYHARCRALGHRAWA